MLVDDEAMKLREEFHRGAGGENVRIVTSVRDSRRERAYPGCYIEPRWLYVVDSALAKVGYGDAFIVVQVIGCRRQQRGVRGLPLECIVGLAKEFP